MEPDDIKDFKISKKKYIDNIKHSPRASLVISARVNQNFTLDDTFLDAAEFSSSKYDIITAKKAKSEILQKYNKQITKQVSTYNKNFPAWPYLLNSGENDDILLIDVSHQDAFLLRSTIMFTNHIHEELGNKFIFPMMSFVADTEDASQKYAAIVKNVVILENDGPGGSYSKVLLFVNEYLGFDYGDMLFEDDEEEEWFDFD